MFQEYRLWRVNNNGTLRREPHMTEASPQSNRGLMIVLAYLWPLALMPFVL